MSEIHRKALLERANSLPLSPGVYIMKDKDGRVIYVGINLIFIHCKYKDN